MEHTMMEHVLLRRRGPTVMKYQTTDDEMKVFRYLVRPLLESQDVVSALKRGHGMKLELNSERAMALQTGQWWAV